MSNRSFPRFILITSLIAGVSLSFFSIFFLSPSFTQQAIQNTEAEAVKVGNDLSRSLQDKYVVFPGGTDFGLMHCKQMCPEVYLPVLDPQLFS